ncbi:MAG TPA: class I SAM-dependent methyltransferase [Tepidisphaeraceae bacterium]|nr:class I SAM-dependent methyltransferase [Tepidisphaeraceae bacterium]
MKGPLDIARAVVRRAGHLFQRQANRVIGPLRGEFCRACGRKSMMSRPGPLDRRLIDAWGLSPKWAEHFALREGCACICCGASGRVRHLAAVTCEYLNARLGTHSESLSELARAPEVQGLNVAEINSLGTIHKLLARLPHLRFSEYGSTDPAVPHEDLSALSYPADQFDLVLTSETLEHVPDVGRALAEIRRVLKPGGAHLFTIPVVWDQPHTRHRARLTNGQVEHLLPPSYHGGASERLSDYLVFSEFGADVEGLIRGAGFDVRVDRDAQNPAIATFVTVKV